VLKKKMVEGEGLLASLAFQASVTLFRCSMLRIVEPDEGSHLPRDVLNKIDLKLEIGA